MKIITASQIRQLSITPNTWASSVGDEQTHHDKLVSTIVFDGVPVALVVVDTRLEIIFVEDGHDLNEVLSCRS